MTDHAYRKLALMAVLSFAAMYVLMFAMVDRLGNVVQNFNQFYMAAVMAAPMVIIELVLMRAMYKNNRLNLVVVAIALIAGFAFFMGIRRQVAINDTQFLRSMIPHHSGAILMCQHADIKRPEVIDLCGRIVSSQEAEIAEMKSLLRARPE